MDSARSFGLMIRTALLALLAALFLIPAAQTAEAADPAPGSIAGSVTGAGGPVTAGQVEIYQYNLDFYDWEQVAVSSLDELGGYTAPGLAPGNYRVKFLAPGFLEEYYDGAANIDDSDDVAVQSGQTTTVSANLTESGTISGTIRGPGGGPVADSNIYLETEAGIDAGAATTSSAGTYEITGLRAGRYAVRIDAPDGSVLAGEWYHNVLTRDAATLVQVWAGTRSTADETLVKGGAITGQVTSATGSTITNGWVTAYSYVAADSAWEWARSTFVNDSGSYRLQGLESNTYRLEFTADGFVDQYYDNVATVQAATDIPLVAGQTKTFNAVLLKVLTNKTFRSCWALPRLAA